MLVFSLFFDGSFDAAWRIAYETGLQPCEAVGVGLFPAVSGKGGVKIRCRLRDVQYIPSCADFVVVGAGCATGKGDGQVCPMPIVAENGIMRIAGGRMLNLLGIGAVQGASTTAGFLHKLVLFASNACNMQTCFAI